MRFTIPDLRDHYVDLARHVAEFGQRVSVRGLVTRELLDVTLLVDPAATLLPVGVNRKVNPRLAAVEALSLLAGHYDHRLVLAAAPEYDRVLVDAVDPGYGAYGPRTARQVRAAAELLRDDPYTRRAVVAVWQPGDLVHTGDRPCTLTLQFLLRDDRLHLFAAMRSQDVWLGVPYDLFMFSQLQLALAAELGVDAGTYHHHVASFHAYERDLSKIENLRCATTVTSPVALPLGVAVPPDDPTGEELTFGDVAAHLLLGVATDAERALNPWYVRQLDAIQARVAS